MKRRKLFFKSNICVCLIMTLLLSVIFSTDSFAAEKKNDASGAEYAVGDNISIGTLDGSPLHWTVLMYDSESGYALVISKNPLDSKSITDYKNSITKSLPEPKDRGYVRWSNNAWRQWLNSTFYKNCFTSAERKMIPQAFISKESEQDSLMNFFHDTSLDAAYLRDQKKYEMDVYVYEHQANATDRIFFMSTDEYVTYKDKIPRDAGSSAKWALRTPSYYAKNRTNCVDESNNGLVEPYYHYENTAIRPCMYLKLKEVKKSEDNKDNSNTQSNTTNTNNNTSNNTNNSNQSSTASQSQSQSTTSNAPALANSRGYANNANDISTQAADKIILPDEGEHDINSGGTTLVTIDLGYLNNSGKKYSVSYGSSDNSIFTVDSNGVITANSKGSAMLDVRMKKSNGKIYNMSCRINVK